MDDRAKSDTASQRAMADIDRVAEAVNAEITTRKSKADDAAATKRNRRFAAAKAARLSEVAEMARAAARQLAAARARVLDEVAKAEAAGFIVQEDWSVIALASGSPGITTEADDHAAALQAAVIDLVALDEQLASRLSAAAKDLQDLSDN